MAVATCKHSTKDGAESKFMDGRDGPSMYVLGLVIKMTKAQFHIPTTFGPSSWPEAQLRANISV